ncbi:MarR family winged helix-turn-helix transcriptional regulator [Aquabacterium sp. J223]|uniref:MarR family winged helix-turn-helix transcriptional regulator n=1 Tax=Aquabacterium sp. J223 TaxID=2898431 RepID=UPI0021AD5D8E|nr:MarR family winged helix-turn-helix transcriptional regulator [Aquabacterium sp. J223]UUX95182.1 MarR family winged helix-turn-helix transcriptional regulator [Aquabacterium sp. J223]
MKKPMTVDLATMPGHCVRRVHQISVALFAQMTESLGTTPVQYSALQTICNTPGLDQKTLGQAIAFDTSTIGGVIDRLEARGLVRREMAAHDRRVRLLFPTPEGEALLQVLVQGMLRSQDALLEPLPPEDRATFMRLLRALIDAHGDVGKAPPRSE